MRMTMSTEPVQTEPIQTKPIQTRPIQSASQTVGPFFHDALIRGGENMMVNDQTRGTRIWLRGRILDGDGQPVPDAMLEVWQADSTGRFNHESDPEQAQADPHFSGFGRSPTDANGAYWFRTIKPGSRDGAAHINVRLFMRGLLIHLVTRIYFSDESNDEVLNFLEPARRQTLIATREDGADGLTYRFDIHLQGDLETVFFDV
jgi:protocatechuate 3,4-dioxygenase, alpha subunit